MIEKEHVEAVEATVAFEEALQTLVLEAFGRGAAVEGTWTIELPAPSVPGWTVEIEKRCADQVGYTPEFIEE